MSDLLAKMKDENAQKYNCVKPSLIEVTKKS